MNIEAYLDRIGYQGPRQATLETLKGLHRAHLLAIPYENLDVQFGTSVTTDPAAAYRKIVERRRGGWCYEMNGLFGWALGELGFSVTRLCGDNRTVEGQDGCGRHLVLRVDLDQPWIADVGCADGPIEPYRLVEGPMVHNGFEYRLERGEDGWWRYHNHPFGLSPHFDFSPDFSDETRLSNLCVWLQTSPASPFVPNAVVVRHTPDGQINMIGRSLRGIEKGEKWSRLIEDADDYVATLKDRFAIDLPQAADLWPKICARHEEIMAARTG